MNDNIASFAYGAIKALIESAPGKVKTRPRKQKVARPVQSSQMPIPFPNLGVDGPNPFESKPLDRDTQFKDIPVTLRDSVNPEKYSPSRENDSEGTQDSIPWMER